MVFCLATYLLYRALSGYDVEEILESIFAVSLPRLTLAGLFVAASYFSLTLFDVLALRYVGARLPYRRIALASFSALSIGHTLGLGALSSGAIRYRFYSRWGIPAREVAHIILFCAVTVGLGLNTLGGVALLMQSELPSDFLGFSRVAARAAGAGCLALTMIYVGLAAFVRRPLRIKQWEILIPPLELALAQVAVGTVNFACVTAALHQLLLSASDVGYFAVATLYVFGNVIGIISHVPGGLGVLEAVILYMMPDEAVFGALVTFRALYFLVPFAIGGSLFLVCELAQRWRGGNEPSTPC